MSAATEQQKHRRRVLIGLILDFNALIRDANRSAEEAMASLAIRRGQYQGRAMDISSIAAVTRIPKASVIRHIAALRKRGCVRSVKVGRRTLQYIPLAPEHIVTTRFYEDVEKAFRQAATRINLELSTMDKASGL
jgi:DNA-binding transcriptional ArsR family regulator